MGVDIKLPIGLMFTILGVLITLFGLFTRSDMEMYRPSFGININLWIGIFMLVFGLAMLLMALRARKSARH
jgi:uncharacterized membrane protein HdeD (DUF308 family)